MVNRLIMNIKDLRVQIDKFINTVKLIQSSREVSLAYTNLQRSFMWLGESLKASGSVSPYQESQNPASSHIEPTADHEEENIFDGFWDIEATQLARVKAFRGELEITITEFRDFKKNSESCGKEYDDCLNESFNALKEAKMWFGWELARIKVQSEQPDFPQVTTSNP